MRNSSPITDSGLRIFCLLFIVCFAAKLSAQSIEYKTQNNLHDLAPVKISLAVMSMETFLFPITFGGRVEGQILDKLHYQANYRQGVVRNFFIPKDEVLTTQKESKGLYIDASAELVFRDKTKPGRVKVITDNTYNSLYSTQSYFIADCDARRYWALSGGISEYARPKYYSRDSSEYIISDGQNLLPPEGKSYHSNISTTSIFAGLTFRKIRKSVVNSGGYNYRRYYAKRFYIQLVSGISTAGDIILNDKSFKIDNIKQDPLGYKIGWQWDEMGVVTGFEFGKQPGITMNIPSSQEAATDLLLNNPFLNYAKLTFHFDLWNSDKNYHQKNKK